MLSIRVYRGGAMVREIRTDSAVLTIGRDAAASIVLDDPDKLISRQHATIECREAVPWLVVHSRVNPVLVDGRVMRTGQTLALAEGARVTMSPYELVVCKAMPVADQAGEPAAQPAAAVAPPPAAPAAPAPAPLAPPDPRAEQLPVDDPVTETTTPWRRSADGGLERATQAFLRGLGLGHLQVPAEEQAFFLERAGVVMLSVVEALVPMLAARARAQAALGVSGEGGAPDANPLAALASPADALAFLVDPSRQVPGGMDAMRALQDVAAGLQAHQEALLAGARAALPDLLQRLDPQAFDAAAAQAAGPLGLNRRSRAWEAFAEAHAALLREAAGDADALLRQAFRTAYLERLRRQDD